MQMTPLPAPEGRLFIAGRRRLVPGESPARIRKGGAYVTTPFVAMCAPRPGRWSEGRTHEEPCLRQPRIHRVGILMYGKRASVAELLRWVKYT
jgi:hypothetical protein